MASIASYEQATAHLNGRDTRKLENNTYLERRTCYASGPAIAVRLHATDVVTYHADGRIVLTSGGWRTRTTLDRLNTYTPFIVAQRAYKWTVYTGQGVDRWNEHYAVAFVDEMTLNGSAPVHHETTAPVISEKKTRRAKREKVHAGEEI